MRIPTYLKYEMIAVPPALTGWYLENILHDTAWSLILTIIAIFILGISAGIYLSERRK